MRRQASVQAVQSVLNAVAVCRSTLDEISARGARRNVVVYMLDQFSDGYCNFLGFLGIKEKGLWHEPGARELTASDVWARERRLHAVLPGFCEPLREGTA